jgi:hypothetical protein
MAQVFSVNAVGYVNKTVPKGGKLALISNPLNAGTGLNTIGNLFKGAPDGTQIYKYNGTAYDSATYDLTDPAAPVWVPDGSDKIVVNPGEGVFVRNSDAADYTVTFVGEVPQGQLDNPYPKGLSIRSSIVPQEGTPEVLGFKPTDGDQINEFDPTTQGYRVSTYDATDPAQPIWNGGDPKPLAVGEAFFLNAAAAGTWSRTFNVSP